MELLQALKLQSYLQKYDIWANMSCVTSVTIPEDALEFWTNDILDSLLISLDAPEMDKDIRSENYGKTRETRKTQETQKTPKSGEKERKAGVSGQKEGKARRKAFFRWNNS